MNMHKCVARTSVVCMLYYWDWSCTRGFRRSLNSSPILSSSAYGSITVGAYRLSLKAYAESSIHDLSLDVTRRCTANLKLYTNFSRNKNPTEFNFYVYTHYTA